MKNLSFVLLAIIGGWFGNKVEAQNMRQIIVKGNLVEATNKQIGVALEWRLCKKNSIEFQYGFQRHNDLPPNVFNGDWTANYVKQRNYIISLSTSAPIQEDGWDYFGTGRPLPASSSPILALSTFYARIGYGMSFQKRPRGPRLLLLPGISLSRHRFFEINDRVSNNETIFESWQIGPSQNQQQLVEQTAYFTQTRQMREKSKWIGGATYALGLAWQSKFGLSFEARFTAGVNFGDAPYAQQGQPNILSNYYGQGTLFIGWAF